MPGSPQGRLDGKVAIVTGASRGIGLGIAERLVAEGAQVCITARQQEALEEAVTLLGGGEHALAVSGKADNLDHQANAIARTMDAFGR
ncbi:MAG: SDR family NAD(P)-dependent oxidoreductase, partial [Actinomycetota bacterium]|nr:SDR family NAD(P)-dependent oxidoreductase [Actinomycetota bacterium]